MVLQLIKVIIKTKFDGNMISFINCIFQSHIKLTEI
jgi:hypothetical protein